MRAGRPRAPCWVPARARGSQTGGSLSVLSFSRLSVFACGHSSGGAQTRAALCSPCECVRVSPHRPFLLPRFPNRVHFPPLSGHQCAFPNVSEYSPAQLGVFMRSPTGARCRMWRTGLILWFWFFFYFYATSHKRVHHRSSLCHTLTHVKNDRSICVDVCACVFICSPLTSLVTSKHGPD